MRITLLSSSILALALVACSSQRSDIAIGEPNGSSSSSGAAAGIVMEQTNMDWDFRNVGTEDEPRTKVFLTITGTDTRRIEMGTYAGNAVDTTSQQTEAILTASLWWAGGGDDLRVLGNGDGTLSLQHRTTDEVSGFGEWMTLQTINE